METSKTITKAANIIPRLRLGAKTDHGVVANGPHRVKFIKDKETKGKDFQGKEIDMVAYLVEENGESKSYRIPKFNKEGEVNYLVIRLAEVNEGDEVILEMKKKGIKNYVEVSPVNQTSKVEIEDDDIPIIGEDEPTDSTTEKVEDKVEDSEE